MASKRLHPDCDSWQLTFTFNIPTLKWLDKQQLIEPNPFVTEKEFLGYFHTGIKY